MMQIEFTALLVGLALAGWAIIIQNIDQRFVIPNSKLPWLFFGGGLFVIDFALRAAVWLLTLFN